MNTKESFAPGRLTAARERRGMTKKAVAEAISVSAPYMTALESGAETPTMEMVSCLSFALRFPIGWFYANPIEELPPQSISFRSRSRMTTKIRDITKQVSRNASVDISPILHQHFRLPLTDLPDLSDEEPEIAAEIIRDYWKLGQGPIKNMVHLLEAKGIEVYWLNVESSCVDAVSFWRDDKPFTLLNLSERSGERGRFNAAHELAHLVLHRRAEIEVVDGRQIEGEADRFASAFLLPARQFRIECPRQPILAQFIPLKQRWGVSIQAMVRRCTDLKVFSHWQYETAFKNISANGWRKHEPTRLEHESSAIHAMAFEKLASKGIYPEDIARQIHISPEDLYEITPAARKVAAHSNSPEVVEASERVYGHLRVVG
ncbi:MAG: XRE family transcriptional regulator [Armatimonadetes bacterium]|nr:XRE family transcriptional regulator [Armatimonadota bacterium]